MKLELAKKILDMDLMELSRVLENLAMSHPEAVEQLEEELEFSI